MEAKSQRKVSKVGRMTKEAVGKIIVYLEKLFRELPQGEQLSLLERLRLVARGRLGERATTPPPGETL